MAKDGFLKCIWLFVANSPGAPSVDGVWWAVFGLCGPFFLSSWLFCLCFSCFVVQGFVVSGGSVYVLLPLCVV
jgi:hypothetical protein